MRIKNSDLERMIVRLNSLVGKAYPEIGSYCLGSAYGMVEVNRIINEGRAVESITGFGSKREVYERLRCFVLGVEND